MQILAPCSIIIKAFMVEALPKLSNVSHAAFSGRWGAHAQLYWELLATLYGCEFELEPFLGDTQRADLEALPSAEN
jgi:hypothetical protein